MKLGKHEDFDISEVQVGSDRLAAGKSTRTQRQYAGLSAPTVQRKATGPGAGASAPPIPDSGGLFTDWLMRPDLHAAPVMRKSDGRAGDMAGGDVQAIAARGVQGGGQQLPHLDAIQNSFGPNHDIAGIDAHVGGAAATAGEAIGAEAYATGNSVAFNKSPDLHTAAHEAAHVVQQRAGVQLLGGVGKAGDTYEQNADAVADRVVAGKSAVDLLPGVGNASGGGDVQRKTGKGGKGAKPVDKKTAEKQGVATQILRYRPVKGKSGRLALQMQVNRGSTSHIEQHWVPRFTTKTGQVLEGYIRYKSVRAKTTFVILELPSQYQVGGKWDKTMGYYARVFRENKEHSAGTKGLHPQALKKIEMWQHLNSTEKIEGLVWLMHSHVQGANKVLLKPKAGKTKAQVKAGQASDTKQADSFLPKGR